MCNYFFGQIDNTHKFNRYNADNLLLNGSNLFPN